MNAENLDKALEIVGDVNKKREAYPDGQKLNKWVEPRENGDVTYWFSDEELEEAGAWSEENYWEENLPWDDDHIETVTSDEDGEIWYKPCV